MYYLCSENKGADQLRGYRKADRGYRKADLRLCFRKCKNPVFSRRGSFFSHHHQCWTLWPPAAYPSNWDTRSSRNKLRIKQASKTHSRQMYAMFVPLIYFRCRFSPLKHFSSHLVWLDDNESVTVGDTRCNYSSSLSRIGAEVTMFNIRHPSLQPFPGISCSNTLGQNTYATYCKYGCKNNNFQLIFKKKNLIFAQNKDWGYTLRLF